MTAARYDKKDLCTECGAHIADPHAPECPTTVEPDVDDLQRLAGDIDPSGNVMAVIARRMYVEAAVQRAIMCPVTGEVLDVRTAVIVDVPTYEPVVIAPRVWDAIKAGIAERVPSALIVTWDWDKPASEIG